jgi:hypothetical protein
MSDGPEAEPTQPNSKTLEYQFMAAPERDVDEFTGFGCRKSLKRRIDELRMASGRARPLKTCHRSRRQNRRKLKSTADSRR